MSVLRFRNNETGEWQEIVTLKGEPGAPGQDGRDGADGKDGADYVLTDADKQEIAGMIDVPGGGGSGGGGTAYILEFQNSQATEETIAILQEYYDYYLTNGTINPDITLIVHNDNFSARYFYITQAIMSNGFMQLLSANDEDNMNGKGSATISNGKITNFSFYLYGGRSAPTWNWNDDYSASQISVHSYSHIKLVFCCDSDSNHLVSFDISTSNNNNFGNEYGTYYYGVYYHYSRSEIAYASFYNYGGNLDTWIDGYTFLGYYYWG